MRAPPAFQTYASDVLANENYRLMTLSERGLLESLRLQCWVSESVPEDTAMLTRLTGIPEDQIALSMTSRVRIFFEPAQTAGRLVCPELVAQRARMEERRAERAQAGTKGARAKWGKEKRGMAEPLAEPSASVEKNRAERSRTKQSERASPEKGSSVPLAPENRKWVEAYQTEEFPPALNPGSDEAAIL